LAAPKPAPGAGGAMRATGFADEGLRAADVAAATSTGVRSKASTAALGGDSGRSVLEELELSR
jgi:hypothetical protein